jgi:hypothetical protein
VVGGRGVNGDGEYAALLSESALLRQVEQAIAVEAGA